MACPRCMEASGLCEDCEAFWMTSVNNDVDVVKSVWKSAHAVEDWPGKVTIRRFSPFKKVCVEGEGETEAEAWKNVADRIRVIWEEQANGAT